MLHKIPNAFLPKSIFCGTGIAQKGNDLRTRMKSRDTLHICSGYHVTWTPFTFSIIHQVSLHFSTRT